MNKNKFVLSNGVSIPSPGFGTWQISEKDAYDAVLNALNAGYRHIDTAFAYQNEKAIGRAIIDSKIPRNEIFITSKLPAEVKDHNLVREYLEKTLSDLKTDYLDLYLIHAPWPWNAIGKNCDKENGLIWNEFVKIYDQKLARAIGVSNFNNHDLDNLLKYNEFVPMVNQICFHIGNKQKEIVEYCKGQNILVCAYSPLATGKILNNEKVNEIALKYQKSVAQIALKYILNKDILPLPKAKSSINMLNNLKLDFTINESDMEILDNI